MRICFEYSTISITGILDSDWKLILDWVLYLSTLQGSILQIYQFKEDHDEMWLSDTKILGPLWVPEVLYILSRWSDWSEAPILHTMGWLVSCMK